MIGRGVFDNPFCFTTLEGPTREQLDALFLYHLDQFDAHSRQPFVTLRHFFKVYFKGNKAFRNRLMACGSTEELRLVLSQGR